MMAVIMQTADLNRDDLSQSEKLWVYNGLDCCITHEILPEIREHMLEENKLIYKFSLNLQAPVLEMDLRGVLIDLQVRADQMRQYEEREHRLTAILNQFSEAAWGKFLNPNSPKQVAEFFYDYMKIPRITKKNRQTGTIGLDTSREALEKIMGYFYARPFIKLILAIKDARKKLSVLKSGIDSDNRMRVAFNIAGTETGRWSSNKNVFGGGMNFQNLTEELRRMFVADPGMKLCYMDLEQAESRGVAYLSGDEDYIAACENGDLHTTVCRMVWPGLKWTGVLSHDKKEVAEQKFYLHYSYRDMSKRGGHGTNYYGTPYTMARHLKIPQEVMESFQLQYFTAFSGIPAWHQNVAERLQTERSITTPFGRKRIFFGRPTDDSTLREAIAYEPQSTIGDALNLGLWRVWKHAPWIQLLGQVHDAILFQYPEEREAEAIALVSELLKVQIPVKGRTMVIPNEAAVGWNWAKFDEKDQLKNPDGLRTWKGSDERTRQQQPCTSLLDIRLSRVHSKLAQPGEVS